MAAPDCDEGVTVHLKNGGVGEDLRNAAVPGVQNPNKAKKTHSGCVSALILLLYYFFFMFYLVSFSRNWWHAALGIAVATAFLLMSFCLSGLCREHNDVKPAYSDSSSLSKTLLASGN